MKRILSVGALVCGLVFSGNLLAESRQDFDLTNQTGYTIKEVYVGPSKSDDWGDNILEGTMPDDSTLHLRFSRPAGPCQWDLKVMYDDGEDAVWYGVDLCTISHITIHWNKQTDETSATVE
ncbi:MAG: argininosuccinate lyase [Magnetococcales bacterium]|nr:argininosuccinate lyase [Magnetococcales bacterium]